MHPEQIKAAMRMAGTTHAGLADELNISPSTVSQVVNGTCTSARVQARIAELTGLAVSTLWPPKKRLVLRRKKPVASGVAA